MSWVTPPNKNRGVTSCPHSSLMRLAHSARHPSHVALAQRLSGAMHAPVLASMSPPMSLDDLIADAIQESIDIRACISSDHSPQGIGDCLELPKKLHAILSSTEFEGAVSWMPHGYAWKIDDLNLFASKVLPMFVDGGTYPENYNNFVCILTSFGFKQLTRGPDTSAYYHEMFLRGIPHLLSLIRPSLGDMSRLRHDTRGEPDFYSFASLPIDVKSSDFPKVSSPRLPHGPDPSRTTAVDFLQHLLLSRGVTTLAGPASTSLTLPPPLHAAPKSTRQPAATNPGLDDRKVSDLCALQHLHHVRLECLSRARQVAEAPSSTSPQQVLATSAREDGEHESKPPKVQLASCPVGSAKTPPKTKRTRRKWLPPLGPPSTSICQRAGANSTPEWYLTNPEVFATLSEGLNETSCSHSKK